MKLFDNFLGKTVLVVLTLIVVVGILIPGIEATLGWATTIDNWTLEQAAEYWESQGYVAYASPDGTLHVYDIEPNDTCTYDLGSLSKYFRNIYINGELVTTGTVTGDLIPTDNDTYDLGSATHQWKDLYITDGSIYLGGRTITADGTQLKVDDTFIGAPGTPDYVVGVNTVADDVPGSSGYWVKSGSTGQVVRLTADAADADDAIQYALDTANAAGKGNVQIAASSTSYTADACLVAKSHVNVDARGAVIVVDSNTNSVDALLFEDVTDTLWTNIELHRTGTVTGLPKCLYLTGTLDNTVQIWNSSFYNDIVTTDASTEGLFAIFIGINQPTSPILAYCYGQINLSATNGDNYAIVLWHVWPGSPRLYHCTGVSTNTISDIGIVVTESTGADTEIVDSVGRGWRGIWLDITTIKMVRCKGIGGAADQGNGWSIRGGSPYLLDCEGIPGKHDNCWGLDIGNSNAFLESCYFHPEINQYRWVYSADNNGRFRPFSGQRYGVWDGWSIWMVSGQPGKTMDIGTTPGGHEVADDIDLTTAGGLYFIPTHVALIADAYFYATISGGSPSDNIYLYYSVIDDGENFGGARLVLDNYFTAKDCRFVGAYYSGSGIAAYLINPTGTQAWKFKDCIFESAVGASGYAIYAASAITAAPIYNPTYIGQLNNILSYADRNSGTATILINTGSIVVNHGLATTPTRVIVTMTSSPGLAVSTWADTYGTTSFTIHTSSNVTSATTFDWRAWVGEGN